ncbi:unnamed protein product, partial [Schistosoma mattheei]
MPVVTSGNQCTSHDDTNPILPILPLEAHMQVLSFNATTLKNTVKIRKPMLRNKNVSTEPSGSRPNNKNNTMTLPNKNKTILPNAMLYLTHRTGGYKGRLDSNVSQDRHCNRYLSRPNIGQTTMNQRALRLSSNVLNNKPVRRNYSQLFSIEQDGLLGYSPSTQPQLADAYLNCPPSQVQQINPPYQNHDFSGLQKSLVQLAIQETKRGDGCIIYALDTLTTNKLGDSVLNSLPESVWISVNTLNHSLLLGCIYRDPDSSNNGNDLIINAFIHASSLNFSANVITGDFKYPGINWSTGNCQSCNGEFSATINMHCWSQWLRTPTRGDSILHLIFSRDVIPLSVKVYDEFESSD